MANPILSLFPWSVIEKCSLRNGRPKLLICQICKTPYRKKNNVLACSRACSNQVRFWQYVEKTADCWIWHGAASKDGYGIFVEYGEHLEKIMWRTHRFAYVTLVGPIPDGLTLDHLCRNRSCIRPAHLEPVSNVENLLRGNSWSGINKRKTHCKHGHVFDEANTYYDKHGDRHCKTCGREWMARKRASQREEAITTDGHDNAGSTETR
jgi:HNH endonuclease